MAHSQSTRRTPSLCPVCGTVFTTIPSRLADGRGLYCSRPCREAARVARRADLFWTHVDRSAGPDACWPWTGATDKNGYGVGRFGMERIRAHRKAWELTFGDIPQGFGVLHRCDNPPCCNSLAHHFLGTNLDNTTDMIQKGRKRTFPGEANAFALYTAPQILEIRQRCAAGQSQHAVAALFGMAQSHVSRIVNGESWGHLPLERASFQP